MYALNAEQIAFVSGGVNKGPTNTNNDNVYTARDYWIVIGDSLLCLGAITGAAFATIGTAGAGIGAFPVAAGTCMGLVASMTDDQRDILQGGLDASGHPALGAVVHLADKH